MSAVRRYRDRYYRTLLPRRYSGLLHLLTVYVAGLAGIAAVMRWAPVAPTRADWWVIPLTLLLGNGVEYAAHRGPMHHRLRWLGALYERHTRRHHRYFRPGEMHFESARDFHAVLFPPVLLLFFGSIAAGLGVLLSLIVPASAAAAFVACALGYYLVYETLHFLYHVPPHWRLGSLPGVSYLARLHHIHHDPQRMQEANFNLVLPLTDRLLGTLDEGRVAPPATLSHSDKPRARAVG